MFTEKRPSTSLKSWLRSACSILLLEELRLEVSSRELYSEHFNSNCYLSTVRPDFLNLRSSLRLSGLVIIPRCLWTVSNPSCLNWCKGIDTFKSIIIMETRSSSDRVDVELSICENASAISRCNLVTSKLFVGLYVYKYVFVGLHVYKVYWWKYTTGHPSSVYKKYYNNNN